MAGFGILEFDFTNADTAAQTYQGGRACVVIQAGTWSTATADLELTMDGSTWIGALDILGNEIDSASLPGNTMFLADLPSGQYRVNHGGGAATAGKVWIVPVRNVEG